MKKTGHLKIILPALIFSFCFNIIQAQLRIDSLLNILGEKYPQEKIYLQFDKNYYNPGETIWFKAYIMADNLSFSLSKTLYADLLDDKGRVLQKKMMPVYASGAAAHFDIPDSVNNTQLFVRAYTSWMLNFDSSLLYIKPIKIIPRVNTAKKTVATDTAILKFFPEGGDMVENINGRIAFKATNQNGEPVSVTGNIVDETGKKLTFFSDIHDGMGTFFIDPQPGVRYKAVWKDKKGISHETALPEPKKTGVSLMVKNRADTLYYTLERPDNAGEMFTSFTVIAQMQHQMVYSAKLKMIVKKTVSAPIITENFPDGILQLTVFNAAQVPVAERLVFINHNNFSFVTDVHLVEKNIIKHGHNTLQVDVADTMLTNLSVAVTDADINPVSKNEESIFSHLLLTTDIKGYVYNPAYYLATDVDSVKQHLDLVMMTNGWRRFKWENVLSQQWPKLNFPIDNYLSLNGAVYGLSKTQLHGKELTGIITTKNKMNNYVNIPLNEKGQFRVTGIYLFDTAKLYYQINNDKDKRLTSIASFSFKNEIAPTPPASLKLLSSLYINFKSDSTGLQKNARLAALQRTLFENNKVKTMEDVKVFSKVKSLKQKLEEEYTSGFFSGGDGYTFSMEDDLSASSALSVLDYLQGKVAGLQINTSGEESVSWRGSTTSVFLDETSTDLSQLQSVSMSNVAMIKVFRPPFFGASGGGAGGAIAVYTKKGGNNSNAKGLDFTLIYGYSTIREFYMPDYEKTNGNEQPDYRSTLFWNPFLIFDKKNRRIKIPFFNSDNCKKFRVVIEGINNMGQLTREEKIFE
jgi:hypothetical protein